MDGQFPWHAYLRIFETTGVVHLCGGSIISPSFILTAGHCVKLGYKYEVQCGSVNRLAQPVVVTAFKSHSHPLYDVAVIELEEPLQLSRNIALARLPPRSYMGRDLTDRVAMVSGFGYGSIGSSGMSAKLLFASQRVMSYSECKRIYGSNVREENMCTDANGMNVCYGDSGGPLVLPYNTIQVYQIGVVSFGADRGCQAGYPSGFVQTTYILDFIEQVTDVVIEDCEGECS